MAQLATVATVVGAGASLLATHRGAQATAARERLAADNAAADAAARAQVSNAQAASDARSRSEALERTVASARARAAAGGVSPDTGSAAAVTAGLRADAARDLAEDETMRAARLAGGRRSLLEPDGSLTTWLRAGSSFAGTARNLLG